MRKLSESLEQDKDRQLSKLQNEIGKRRKKRKDKRKKEIEEEEVRAAKADEEEERKELLKVNQEQAEQLKTQVDRVRPKSPVRRTPRSSAAPSPESPRSPPTPVPAAVPMFSDVQLGEKDLSQLMLSTPLLGQVAEIESLLHNQLAGQGVPVSPGVCQPYIDVRDAQWECKGDLIPVDVQSLRPSDFVVYRFGVFVVQLLHNQNHLPEVSVLLASNLPPNNYTRNCFRNSFHYQHAGKLLFIRKERMESVGEFVLVVMHCLAHIKAGDLTDDTNPLFLRAFYQASAYSS